MTRVAVYGAGAVGGYLGARLALAHPDLDLTLVGRRRLVEGVHQHGLIVREGDAESITHPVVTTSATDLAPCDLVLLTVRTYDVESSIPDVRRLMGERGLCLAFQNGVGTEEVLSGALGPQRVLACTLTVSAGMEEPGIITRYSRGGGVALATMNGSSVPSYIVDLFTATGLPTVTIGDHRSLRWSKLLLNMLCAPSSAILDMDMAEIVGNPHLFRLEQLAFREAVRVMDAANVRTVSLPGYPVPLARAAMRLIRPLAQGTLGRKIVNARGGRSPGMRGDIARGKTEVAAFNGAIAAEAERVGVRAPINRGLASLTEDLAAHPERRAHFRRKPQALIDYISAEPKPDMPSPAPDSMQGEISITRQILGRAIQAAPSREARAALEQFDARLAESHRTVFSLSHGGSTYAGPWFPAEKTFDFGQTIESLRGQIAIARHEIGTVARANPPGAQRQALEAQMEILEQLNSAIAAL